MNNRIEECQAELVEALMKSSTKDEHGYKARQHLDKLGVTASKIVMSFHVEPG
jgi:hypothetical protein